MLKLTRLKIEKFRNVAPGTELRFHDKRNVLLGRNGSGKTTLLNLISMALMSDFSDLQKEEFELEFDLEFGRDLLWAKVSNRSVSASGEVPLFPGQVLHQTQLEPAVEVSVKVGDRIRKLKLRDRKWTLETEVGEEQSPGPWADSLLDFKILILVLMQRSRSHSPRRFDESLEFLRAILTGEVAFSSAAKDVWIHSLLSLLSIRAVRVLQARMASRLDPAVVTGQELPWISDAALAMGFESAEMRLDLIEKKADGDVLLFGNCRFRFFRKDGSFIENDRLSYGQRRLLSFLYYLDLNDNNVVADEIDGGLHYDWLRLCMEQIGDRQAFLASQNPLLFDHLRFESVEDVQRQFIICNLEQVDGRERLVWKNLDIVDAERFFKAYQVGIQHVGEILRDKGLW